MHRTWYVRGVSTKPSISSQLFFSSLLFFRTVNPFRAAVPFWEQNHYNSKYFVPKTRLRSSKGQCPLSRNISVRKLRPGLSLGMRNSAYEMQLKLAAEKGTPTTNLRNRKE